MTDEDKPKVRVLSMGEAVPTGPERFLVIVQVSLDNERDARHLAHHLAHIFQALNVQGTIAVVGAQEALIPIPGS